MLSSKYSKQEAGLTLTSVDETQPLIVDKILTNFSLEGYERSKRYIGINIPENKATYWKYIYENRINNIVLLEDRLNENMVFLISTEI